MGSGESRRWEKIDEEQLRTRGKVTNEAKEDKRSRAIATRITTLNRTSKRKK